MKRVAVLGIGSVRCAIPVILSLATYFGERPMEIVLWDADIERLDLFDRLLRVACATMETPHRILSTDDPAEALAETTHVVWCVEDYCIKKLAKGTGITPEVALDKLATLTENVEVLRLPTGNWPPELTEAEAASVPHQALRWIRSEEYLIMLLDKYPRSPLHDWLREHVAG